MKLYFDSKEELQKAIKEIRETIYKYNLSDISNLKDKLEKNGGEILIPIGGDKKLLISNRECIYTDESVECIPSNRITISYNVRGVPLLGIGITIYDTNNNYFITVTVDIKSNFPIEGFEEQNQYRQNLYHPSLIDMLLYGKLGMNYIKLVKSITIKGSNLDEVLDNIEKRIGRS